MFCCWLKKTRRSLGLTQTVARDRLTTLMVTHNMRDAIRMGNRLIMMHEGQVIVQPGGPGSPPARRR